MTRTQPASRRPRRRAVLLPWAVVTALLAASTLPAASSAAVPPASTAETGARGGTRSVSTLDARPATAAETSAIDDTTGQRPSVMYEDSLAHERDHIDFTPGGRVAVGYAPRANDRWPVDGKSPVELPAGRATGREMAATRQGDRWAPLVGRRGVGSRDPAASAGDADIPAAAGPVDAPANDEPIAATSSSWTAPAPAADAQLDPAATAGLRRQVFGFLPYWEASGAATKLNYGVLSTIAYFSVGADKGGNLKKRSSDGSLTTGWRGWTSSSMSSVISAAHSHGTRVVLTISVFAWTTSQASVQKALLGSSSARLNLARQVAAAVRDRGADGVNLDFEPIASGYADEFVSLLKSVRSELNRIHSGYQLTYDTTGYIGNYPLEASVGSGAADAIFVMGYDYRTSSSSYAGSIDPLSGPAYDLTDTIRSYTARVPASRVILGVPWYGRAWSTVSSDLHAGSQSGLKYGYSAAVNYENVVSLAADHGRRWDSTERSAWVAYKRQNCTSTYGCVTSWREVYYDDATALKARYTMVNDYGLRGSGIWALGYDGGHAELYRAISDSFLVDKSAPQAGIRALPAAGPDEGFVVSWAARDTSSIAYYDVQVSVDGGAWTAWRTGTRATSDVWLGHNAHGYAFRVRAADSKGNVGAWNVTSVWTASPSLAVGGFARITADGLSYRTGPDTSAAKLGSLPAGTIVALTAGPRSADGYTWWEVTEPLKQWGAVSFVERGVWIAGSSSSDTFIRATIGPNTTRVQAGLTGFGFGASGSGVGTSAAARLARVFSPNGDGAKDKLRIHWSNQVSLDALTFNVLRTDGSKIGSRAFGALSTGAKVFDWNGVIGTSRLPDGHYLLVLTATAGGHGYHAPSSRPATSIQIASYAITIDTVRPVISSASASLGLISPNGDGTRDSVAFSMAATGSTHWQLRIVNAAGSAVRTINGTGTKASVSWNGRSDAGSVVADGRYRAGLFAIDDAGNRAHTSFAVTVDTRRPVVAAGASPASFSPNGDGTADTTTLRWSANEKASGSVRIYHGTTLVRSWAISSLASWAHTWDGTNASGSRVGDGRYTYRLDIRDLGGNRTVVSSTVTVDRTAGMLRWTRNFYPQDGDSLTPTSKVSFRLSRQATTSLRILGATGTIVRSVWTGRTQAAGTHSWTWNGKTAAGTYVKPGRYTAQLTATTSLGTVRLTRVVVVDAFATTLSATRVKVGQTLVVHFRSIEALSTRPVVSFTQPGRTGVSVTATRLTDGSFRASFTVRSGSAGSATVRISAKDTNGGTNRSVLTLTVVS